jgi:hypothetical protein
MAFKQTWKPLSTVDVEEVIYDKVGRTPSACMPSNSNFPVWRYRAEHFFRKSKYKSGDLNEFSKTHFPS